ncbi:MAG: hypothetical protein QM751_10275 [Paludibacteraceae bacterium]
MKKKYAITIFCITLSFIVRSYAQQLPLASTSSNPVWYYIQVKGNDDGRMDLVFTAEGTEVHGRTKLDGVNNPSMVSTQLWRFEDAGENYFIIINKSTGQKIDVAYDASRSIGYATLTDVPASKFKFVENTSTEGYYSIQSAIPASGGSSSEIYLHQANNGGNRDYIIMLVGTDYGFGINSAFNFTLYNDYTINYSDDTNEIWYNITSAQTGVTNMVIRDNSQNTSAIHQLSVEPLQSLQTIQQWKLVKNGVNGEIYLINRSTGNYIQSQSVADEAYNIPQLGAMKGAYTLTYLGQGQYLISSVEEDAVIRYLHLSSDETIPQEYDAKNAKDSGFAWLFLKVQDGTDVHTSDATDLKISVINSRIVVNTDEYTVRTVTGTLIRRNAALQAGVYLVSTKEKTVKVLVK